MIKIDIIMIDKIVDLNINLKLMSVKLIIIYIKIESNLIINKNHSEQLEFHFKKIFKKLYKNIIIKKLL